MQVSPEIWITSNTSLAYKQRKKMPNSFVNWIEKTKMTKSKR